MSAPVVPFPTPKVAPLAFRGCRMKPDGNDFVCVWSVWEIRIQEPTPGHFVASAVAQNALAPRLVGGHRFGIQSTSAPLALSYLDDFMRNLKGAL